MTKQLRKITLKSVLIGMLVVSIAGLVVYNIKDLLFGAPLSVITAKDGATLEDTYLPISGSAAHARELLINGRSVALDRKGKFSDSILLSPGYNIVEVSQRDRFGNEKVERHHFMVITPSTVAQTNGTTYQQ